MTDAPFRKLAVAKILKYADETSWEKVARLYVKAYEKTLRTTLPGYNDIEVDQIAEYQPTTVT
jgi:hypothetical protein